MFNFWWFAEQPNAPQQKKFDFFKSTFLTWPKYAPLNISAEYQWFHMKPSEQGLFFQAGQNESKEWYAMTKTYENINIIIEMSFLQHPKWISCRKTFSGNGNFSFMTSTSS